MIETLGSLLNQGLAVIVPMTILLGLLIFVHELGHFLAAKYYGVRVETFSLGFGPKIIQFAKDGTVYCISALPFGGYVKMFGDEPGKEISPELQKVSFLHKPVGQRIVIALAGPLMNLFFAAFLFYGVATVGDKALSPAVGELATNSMAYEAGFRPYDSIVAIDGQPVETWDDVSRTIEASTNKTLSFELKRQGEQQSVSAKPVATKNQNILSSDKLVGSIDGLSNSVHLPFVGVESDSPLSRAGLKTGDHITKINGQPVSYFRDIFSLVRSGIAEGTSTFRFTAHRYKNFEEKEPAFDEVLSTPVSLSSVSELSIFLPETVVAQVRKDSPAQTAGVQVLDKILKINETPIGSFDDIVGAVSSFQPGEGDLRIQLLRGGTIVSLAMSPEATELEDRFGIKENRFTIGIVPLKNAMPLTFDWKASDVGASVNHAFDQTWHWTKVTCLSFVRMIQGRVPTKNIGGVISIGQVASHSWAQGLGSFLKIMAIISINLFILNLLPIPILDGGHLLLFFLEAIKGSPLSLRKIQFAQQVGFLFILFLMAFALFNDFSRLLGS